MAIIPIERKRSGSMWRMLLLLLVLVLLAVWLMRSCNALTGGRAGGADTTAAAASAAGTASVAGAPWDADLGFVQTASGLRVHGRAPSDSARTALLAALGNVYPGVSVDADSLLVDASAPTGAFLARAGSLFGFLGQVNGAGLGLAGTNVTVRGDVRSAADRDAVGADLSGALPQGYVLANELNVVAPSPEVAAADSLIRAALVRPIPFASGTARLGAGATDILDRVAAALAQYPSVSVSVEGHTDATGDPSANTALSEQRARAVMEYLLGNGIAAGRMTATGYGASRPVASNDTEAGRAENRRVVFATR